LAVIADVDAGGLLLRDHAAHRLIHLRIEYGLVDRLSRLAPDQEIGQRVVARQAADMGGQDAVAAELHGRSGKGLWGSARGRSTPGIPAKRTMWQWLPRHDYVAGNAAVDWPNPTCIIVHVQTTIRKKQDAGWKWRSLPKPIALA